MIIDSEGKEIELLIGYLKNTLYIACRSYQRGGFFLLFRGNFLPDFRTAKAKVPAL